MPPPVAPRGKPVGQEHKSWKKINEERKALKREQRQERLIKQVENAEKLMELAKANEAAEATKKSNPSTLSIAVPGSILENAQSPGLRSYLAGQIARAASIFRVNEIIVFDDIGIATARDTKVVYETETNGDEETNVPQTARRSSVQLARILQYLECPQYLRKFFFPLHKDLMHSGLLNPLDTPHHLRQQSMFIYREGIVTERQAKEGRCFVNVGLPNDVLVDKAITPGIRVTVKLKTQNESKKLRGTVVSPDEPRRETGVYWGYTVRIAHSFADVFTKSPYSGGYDHTIGTSDRGSSILEVPQSSYEYNHMLIVFGGLAGLETALANDEKLKADDPALLFDHYLNVLPKQGSRTIRTEEALLIALTALQEKLKPQVPDIEDTEYKELLPRSDDVVTQTFNKPKFREDNDRNPFDMPFRKGNNSTNSDGSTEEIVTVNPFTAPTRREGSERNAYTAKIQSNKQKDVPFRKENNNSYSQAALEDTERTNQFKGRSRNESSKRNPFTTKVHKNERKRKHVENNDVSTTKVHFNNPMPRGPEKIDRNRKQKETVPSNMTAIDDLEVVPASGIMPARHKKPKKDIDLSRFD